MNDMINIYHRLKNDNYPLNYISDWDNKIHKNEIIQEFKELSNNDTRNSTNVHGSKHIS